MAFDYTKVKKFIFEDYEFNQETLELSFKYAFDDGNEFVEKITFPKEALVADFSDSQTMEALDKAFKGLHLVAGTSYYKAAAPREIEIKNQTLDKGQADILNRLYREGFGEFSYINDIKDIDQRINFPYDGSLTNEPSSLELPDVALVPVGGGKDSVVTIEGVREAGIDFGLFSLGKNIGRDEVAKVSGKPMITVDRKISKRVIELNDEGALNGHIPISAFFAMITPIIGILYGFNSGVLSNESSANEVTLVWNGKDINHQYSKSLDAEKNLNQYIKKYVLRDFEYFSLLRPFKEIQIVKIFSTYPQYFSVFTSCNVAQRGSYDGTEIWCGKCPKCLFGYMMLAQYLPKEKMTEIFYAEMLDDPEMKIEFLNLLGMGDHKPFECVGHSDECIEAMRNIAKKDDYEEDLLVKLFLKKDPQIENPSKPSTGNLIPAKFKPVIDILKQKL